MLEPMTQLAPIARCHTLRAEGQVGATQGLRDGGVTRAVGEQAGGRQEEGRKEPHT
jgi:hypothetical protein